MENSLLEIKEVYNDVVESLERKFVCDFKNMIDLVINDLEKVEIKEYLDVFKYGYGDGEEGVIEIIFKKGKEKDLLNYFKKSVKINKIIEIEGGCLIDLNSGEIKNYDYSMWKDERVENLNLIDGVEKLKNLYIDNKYSVEIGLKINLIYDIYLKKIYDGGYILGEVENNKEEIDWEEIREIRKLFKLERMEVFKYEYNFKIRVKDLFNEEVENEK